MSRLFTTYAYGPNPTPIQCFLFFAFPPFLADFGFPTGRLMPVLLTRVGFGLRCSGLLGPPGLDRDRRFALGFMGFRFGLFGFGPVR